MVGASGFEPPTSWSRTMNTNSINALSGVAYGTRNLVSPLLIVRSLSVAQQFRSLLRRGHRLPDIRYVTE